MIHQVLHERESAPQLALEDGLGFRELGSDGREQVGQLPPGVLDFEHWLP
jgi:hypothetical protein